MPDLVAELPAAPRQHSGDSTVGRAPSGRAPATAPARSCDLCSQHTHVFRRALGEFGGSGRVPGRDPAPATPGDVSSYDMAVGRGHVITMQCFDAPATSSVYPSCDGQSRQSRAPRTARAMAVLSGRSTTNLASRFTGPPQTLSLLEQRKLTYASWAVDHSYASSHEDQPRRPPARSQKGWRPAHAVPQGHCKSHNETKFATHSRHPAASHALQHRRH